MVTRCRGNADINAPVRTIVKWQASYAAVDNVPAPHRDAGCDGGIPPSSPIAHKNELNSFKYLPDMRKPAAAITKRERRP